MATRIDARQLEPGTELRADVVIIGAGPAGITVARQLAGGGLDVVVLESGGEAPDPETAQLAAGHSVGYPYHPLERSRLRGFGGTSEHWELDLAAGDNGWFARPMDPVDFEARPGLPHSGWPITYDDLLPYYERAQPAAGLGRFRYDPASFTTDETPVIEAPGVATPVFQFGPTNFTGHLPELEAAPNVRVLLHATVRELELDADGRTVDRVRVLARRDAPFFVRARSVVVAAGAIDTARLLLDSRSVRPEGVGNEHDLVGRYFMERLLARSGHIAASPALLAQGLDRYRVRVVEGQRIRGSLSLDNATVRREGLANATFFVIRRPKFFASEGARSFVTLYRSTRREPRLDDRWGHAKNVIRDLPDLARTGAWLARRGRLEEGDTLLLAAQAEQRPNPDSRVELDTATDALGGHRPRLNWQLTADDRVSIRRTQDLLDTAFDGAGLGRLRRRMGQERPQALFIGAYHHMGTARMHADPRHGVVDADARVHSVANLFIASSAVFPTSGYANPTLTIVALAIRLADHLRTTLEHPEPARAGSGRRAATAKAAGPASELALTNHAQSPPDDAPDGPGT